MSTNSLPAVLPPHAVISADLRSLERREHLPRLVLVRGLPGSGKSTLAASLRALDYMHFEADQFFVVDGQYRFDARLLGAAHRQCQQNAARALAAGKRVVVSNTFTRMAELAPYLSMTRDAVVVRTFGPWKNVHDVPASRVQQMACRWEPCGDCHDLVAAQPGPARAATHLRFGSPHPGEAADKATEGRRLIP